MNKQQLEAFAREAAKSIKTESDLSDFTQMLSQSRHRNGSERRAG